MPGFTNEYLSNGKLVFEILPFTHRPLITRRCSFTVVPETTPLALRILAKQLVEPLKPSSVEYNIHIDHKYGTRVHTPSSQPNTGGGCLSTSKRPPRVT